MKSLTIIIGCVFVFSSTIVTAAFHPSTNDLEKAIRLQLNTGTTEVSFEEFVAVATLLNDADDSDLQSLSLYAWGKIVGAVNFVPKWVGMPPEPLNQVTRIIWPYLSPIKKSDLLRTLSGFASAFHLTSQIAFEAGYFIVRNSSYLPIAMAKHYSSKRITEIYVHGPSRQIESNSLDQHIESAFLSLSHFVANQSDSSEIFAIEYLRRFIAHCHNAEGA